MCVIIKGLHCTCESLYSQILQLYASIQQKEPVILAGPSGSGKSTSLCILSRALNRLNALLFAPDHSKDELTAERDFMYHAKQKLQVGILAVHWIDNSFFYIKNIYMVIFNCLKAFNLKLWLFILFQILALRVLHCVVWKFHVAITEIQE